MPENKKYQIAILGGGISGLSAALRAGENNLSNIVIERAVVTGGLWGSVERKGHVFDYGVHGLYAACKENEEIVEYVKNLVKDGFVRTEKLTKIVFKGKLLNYPLIPGEFFFKYGLEGFVWAVTLVYARMKCTITGDKWMKNFRDYVVGNFGGLLYRIYFEPYVKKVWGLDPKQLSLEAIARRVRKIRVRDFVAQTIKRIFGKRHDRSYDGLQPISFIYPKHGAAKIVATIREEAQKRGTQVITQTAVTAVRREGTGYAISVKDAAGQVSEIRADYVISSLPLPDLLSMLYPGADEEVKNVIQALRYRALRILNILIDREKVFEAQWIYFQGNEFTFSRLNEFKNLSSHFSPQGMTSLSIEFNCDVGDRIWNMSDDDLLDIAVRELDHYEAKGSYIKHHIVDHFSVKLSHAYPLMETDTLQKLERAKQYVADFKNVYSIGRQGNFCYVNGDECIRMAWNAVDKIKKSEK